MGALTFTYTSLEQVNVTGATITITGSSVAFGLSNIGTSDVVISQALVTGGSYSNQAGTITAATGTCTVTSGAATIPKGASCSLTATFTTGGSFAAGTSYAFTLLSSKGNKFPYTVTA